MTFDKNVGTYQRGSKAISLYSMCNILDSHLHHINRKLNASVSILYRMTTTATTSFFFSACFREGGKCICLSEHDGRWHNFIWRTENILAHWLFKSQEQFVGVNLRWWKLFFFTWLNFHPFYRRFDMSRFIHKFYLVISTHCPFYFYADVCVCVWYKKKLLLVRSTKNFHVRCYFYPFLQKFFLQSNGKIYSIWKLSTVAKEE